MADPFSGAVLLGAAASLAQIVALAFHVGNKLYKFADDKMHLPQNLQTIKRRLDLMAHTLRDIDTSNMSSEASQNLGEFLVDLDRKLTAFQKMLDDYLPEKDASTVEKLKKGFASLGKDDRIAAFADELSKDVDHLSLFLLTQGFSSNHSGNNDSMAHLKGREIFEVPRREVAKFVGREDVLQQISDDIEESPVVLLGMGGQGKSQVALQYCRRSRHEKRYKAILWANASSEAAVKESFESFSDVLKAPDQTFLDADARIWFVKRILHDWSEPWLLVLDNFDDATSFNVRNFMCNSAKSHFLITSRSSDTRRLGKAIQMSGMTEKEGLELCMNTGEIEATDVNIQECLKITRRLGQLPLAIDLAAAYIRERVGFMKLEDFLPRYNAQAQAILKFTPGVSEYAEDHREAETNIFATFEMTRQLLEPDSEIGAKKLEFLDILGFFNNNHLSETIFQTYHNLAGAIKETPAWFSLFVTDGAWDSTEFENLVVRLANLNLVHSPSRDDEGYLQFSIHPLISDWLRIRQSQIPELGTLNYHLSASMLSCFLMEYYIEFLLQPAFKLSFKQHNAFVSHFVAREQWSDFFSNQPPTMIKDAREKLPCVELRVAVFLYDSGFSTSSLKICERLWQDIGTETEAQRIVKRAAGAYMWHNLCTIHRHKEAQTRAKEVAAFWEQRLGPAHPFTLEALHYLACSLSWVGANDESEEVLRDVLSKVDEYEHWDQVCAENCWLPRPVWSLTELAYSLSRQRSASKQKEAAEAMEQVMAVRKTNAAIKKGSCDWAWRHYSLAISLAETPTVKSALAWELLSVIQKAWGKQHSNFFLAQVEVIGALLDREDRKSQERMTKVLLQGAQSSSHASGYRFMLWGLKRLSTMFLNQGKLVEAETLLRQMLDINREMPDSASASAFILKDLGLCLFRQCKYVEANATLGSIKSRDIDLDFQHALVKCKLGSPQALNEADQLLAGVLENFVIEDDPTTGENGEPDEPDPSSFSLSMMIAGSDPSDEGPRYKLEVNGCLSCEALILKGLVQLRIGDDLEASSQSISTGRILLEESDEKLGLALEVCRFIQAQVDTLIEASESPPPEAEGGSISDPAATEQVVDLVQWAISQISSPSEGILREKDSDDDSSSSNSRINLLRQLEKQTQDLKELKKLLERQELGRNNFSDQLSGITSAASSSERGGSTTKRSKFASIFSTSSSKSPRGSGAGAGGAGGGVGTPRADSYSSEAKTLIPQRTHTWASEGSIERKLGSLSVEK